MYYQTSIFTPLIVALLCVNLSFAQAQTISQRQSQGTTALYNGGQSFTATLTGHVTEIHILVAKDANNRQLRLYSTEASTNDKAVHTETINLKEGWNTLLLTTPFQVREGEQYLFTVSGTIIYKGHFGNIYKQGHTINNNQNAASRTDLAFEIVQELEK